MEHLTEPINNVAAILLSSVPESFNTLTTALESRSQI